MILLQIAGQVADAENAAPGFVQKLWTSLEQSYGPQGPFYAIAAVGMLFSLLALPLVLRKDKDPLERFSFREDRLDQDLVRLRADVDNGSLRGLAPILEPSSEKEMSATRTELRAAGFKSPSAVRVYFFTKAMLALFMMLIGFVLFFLIPDDPDIVFSATFTIAFGMFGYLMPIYYVKRSVQTRQEEIRNSFPDAMDMMLVCIEGGQSLDQAMARVGEEMQASGTPLAEEMLIVTQEFRAGKDRATVLRDFADRCNVNDISSFVTVLIQSSAFGTSISNALRVYASEMRDKRLMRAEEKANVLPTKLTLGTMAFTVPPLILILVGPSFIQIVRSLTRFGGG